jgi:hypothetical protein
MTGSRSVAEFLERTRRDLHAERYCLCLLKNSCFVKIARISKTGNVYQNGDSRL